MVATCRFQVAGAHPPHAAVTAAVPGLVVRLVDGRSPPSARSSRSRVCWYERRVEAARSGWARNAAAEGLVGPSEGNDPTGAACSHDPLLTVLWQGMRARRSLPRRHDGQVSDLLGSNCGREWTVPCRRQAVRLGRRNTATCRCLGRLMPRFWGGGLDRPNPVAAVPDRPGRQPPRCRPCLRAAPAAHRRREPLPPEIAALIPSPPRDPPAGWPAAIPRRAPRSRGDLAQLDHSVRRPL